MAVVTLSRLRVAEARDLTVVGLEIGLGDRFVAAAALTHDAQLESLRVRAADGVRGVAVIAHRQFLVGLCDAGRMHAALELLYNAVVIGAAGGGEVVAVGACRGAGAGEQAGRGGAARARRGEDEPAFDESL